MILMLGIDVPSDSIKGPHRSRTSGSAADQPWSPMFRAQSSAGTRCEQTAKLNVLSEMPADSIGAATTK
jgi:hypothetical protein